MRAIENDRRLILHLVNYNWKVDLEMILLAIQSTHRSDDELNQQNLEEINFRNIDELVSKGDFFAAFTKGELEDVFKFLELERRIGSHNMAMEGGKFLLMGPDYIKDFFKLQSYHNKPSEKKQILINKLIDK